jgi:copper chaperone CopZ
MASLNLKVSGMHCGNCVSKVERALKSVPGTYGAAVDLEQGTAEVDFDGTAPAEKFIDAIRSAGYRAEVGT